MRCEKTSFVFIGILLVFIVGIFLASNLGFVFAEHVVNNSDGGTSFSINDNTNTQFNITVNNTDAGQAANITSVNITFPSGANCSFADGSNATDSDADTFINTSNVLSWTNSSGYVINGSEWKSFWFNLTCQNAGDYNLIVTTTNITDNYNSTLSLEINDTATFSGNLTSPTNGTLLTVNSTTLNYTLSSGTFNCSTYVWYSNGTLSESSSDPVPVNETGDYSLSGIDDNIYKWNVYCVNASDSNDERWLNTTYNWTFTIATHEFYGYVMNASNKSQGMNNTNITFTIYTNIMRDTIFQEYTGNANSEGWFNITNISFPRTGLFGISLVKYNETNTLNADYVGPSIPEFMRDELTGSGPRGDSIQNTTFYLRKGATINISAHNGTEIIGSVNISFYQVKDKSLGFPIAMGSSMGSGVYYTNFTVDLDASRNYTVMIYPTNAMPVSLDIDSANLSSGYFNYSFNTNETTNRLTGYVNVDGGANFTSLYVVTYLLEPGRMIYFGEHARGLFNLSGDDVYNTTSGFYNISVPGSHETVNAIIMPVAFNASGESGEYYYGGFKSANLNWTGPSETNFTLKKFRSDYGNPDNLSVEGWVSGLGNITVPLVGFNILANGSAASSPFVEIQLDYSSLNMTNFSFMVDGDNIAVPLLEDVGIKKMNVFSQSGAPLKKKFSNSSLPGVGNGSAVNLTLRQAMGASDSQGNSLENMFIDMIQNSDVCNVPNYNVSECSFFGAYQDLSEINPMRVVMSGAEMSFVMKNANNITVIYKNVDMIASGPPDIAFDTEGDDSGKTTTTFEEAWKFGSSGPEIYDGIIIGIPYTVGSTSQTGFNESAQMNMTIPILYDEDYIAIWDSSSGDNVTNITDAGIENELSDFADYVGSEYEAYLNGTYPECNTSDVNLSSGLCYKDIDNNMLWFRIPHFSGVGPSPTGAIITADPVEDDDTPSSGGGGGGVAIPQPPPKKIHSWAEIIPGVVAIMKDFDSEIGIKQITISVNNPAQNVKITVTKYDDKPAEVAVEKSGKVHKYLQIETENLELNLETARIRIQVQKSWMENNNLQTENLAMFKLNENNNQWDELETIYVEADDNYFYYDVELDSFSFFAIGEKVVEEVVEEDGIAPVDEEEVKKRTWLWILIAVVVLVLIWRVVGRKIVKTKISASAK